jgi:hypothetical protein
MEIDVKLFAVTPTAAPSTSVVTIVTPVAYWPRHCL